MEVNEPKIDQVVLKTIGEHTCWRPLQLRGLMMGADPLGTERKNDEAHSAQSRHFRLGQQQGIFIEVDLL